MSFDVVLQQSQAKATPWRMANAFAVTSTTAAPQLFASQVKNKKLSFTGGHRVSCAIAGRRLAIRIPTVNDPQLSGDGLRSLENMLAAMDHMMFDDLPGLRTSLANTRAPWEVKETEEAFHLRFDMPGLTKDDVSVKIEGGKLVISGERKGLTSDNLNLAETQAKSFMRPLPRSYHTVLSLPDNVIAELMQSDMTASVLTVMVPKYEETDEPWWMSL